MNAALAPRAVVDSVACALNLLVGLGFGRLRHAGPLVVSVREVHLPSRNSNVEIVARSSRSGFGVSPIPPSRVPPMNVGAAVPTISTKSMQSGRCGN